MGTSSLRVHYFVKLTNSGPSAVHSWEHHNDSIHTITWTRCWITTYISHNFQDMRRWTNDNYDLHITFAFEWGFKNTSRNEAKGACLKRLRILDIQLSLKYANPLDTRLNIITKNWSGFLELHKKYLHKNKSHSRRGDVHSWWRMERRRRPMWRKGLNWQPKLRTFASTSKGHILRGKSTHNMRKSCFVNTHCYKYHIM